MILAVRARRCTGLGCNGPSSRDTHQPQPHPQQQRQTQQGSDLPALPLRGDRLLQLVLPLCEVLHLLLHSGQALLRRPVVRQQALDRLPCGGGLRPGVPGVLLGTAARTASHKYCT